MAIKDSPEYDHDKLRGWVDELRGLVLPDVRGNGLRNVVRGTDVSAATLARQYKEGSWQADTIVNLCRHYKQSPLNPLMWAGYLSPDDVIAMQTDKALLVVSDRAITDEVLRRMQRGTESELSQPLADVE